MNEHRDTILSFVARALPRFRAIGAPEASRPLAPGKWSRKEIVGHLVDSAVNNHQRFVRALLADSLEFPGYAQNPWVSCQGYAEEDWGALVDLWSLLNRHIAYVVGRIPEAKRSTPCRIGENPGMTLEALVAGYISHVEHHVGQV
jgi:hypothetical protein